MTSKQDKEHAEHMVEVCDKDIAWWDERIKVWHDMLVGARKERSKHLKQRQKWLNAVGHY